MTDEDVPYEVGYGKPPRENQFQKGKSGNQKGRPRGARNFATVALRESRRIVQVNGPRGSRQVPKLEAAVMQLANKAAQGDLRAVREFVALIQRSEQAVTSDTSNLQISELDKKMLESLRNRISRVQSEKSTPEQEP
jgi:hypothetical protein